MAKKQTEQQEQEQEQEQVVVANEYETCSHLRATRKIFGIVPWYNHHGLYLGAGKIIHFSGEVKDQKNASIREGAFSDFLDSSATASIVSYEENLCFSAQETIERAQFRLGHLGFRYDNKKYDLFNNNCEHFCTWAKTGIGTSLQIKSLKEGGMLSLGMFVARAGRIALLLFRGAKILTPVGILQEIVLVGAPLVIRYLAGSDGKHKIPSQKIIETEIRAKLYLAEIMLESPEMEDFEQVWTEIFLLSQEIKHLTNVSEYSFTNIKQKSEIEKTIQTVLKMLKNAKDESAVRSDIEQMLFDLFNEKRHAIENVQKSIKEKNKEEVKLQFEEYTTCFIKYMDTIKNLPDAYFRHKISK